VVECYFNGVTHSGFERTDLMNNRPRKCLGWKTPFEVFAKMTGKDYFINGSVALTG
jgi:IS30 family transposase